jgi:hypothetical protein
MTINPQTPPSARKKQYRAPQLQVYGSLAALTKSNSSSNGMNDPGSGSTTKTG